jgi:hypothetical protein
VADHPVNAVFVGGCLMAGKRAMEAMSVVLTYGGSELSSSGAVAFGSLGELAKAG